MTEHFETFLSEWTTAELAGDVDRLATLAAIHMSFIAGTQGSPPLRESTNLAQSSSHVRADGEG
jgi:hypothetical protein